MTEEGAIRVPVADARVSPSGPGAQTSDDEGEEKHAVRGCDIEHSHPDEAAPAAVSFSALDSISAVSAGTNTAERLISMLQQKIDMHLLAEKFYRTRDRLFVWPGIMMTSAASALSFCGAAYETRRVHIDVAVGVITSLTSMIWGLSAAYGYGARCNAHSECADQYERIKTSVYFKSLDQQEQTDTEEAVWYAQIQRSAEDVGNRSQLALIPPHIQDQYRRNRHEFHRKALRRNLYTMAMRAKYEKMKVRLLESSGRIDLSVINRAMS